MSEIQEPKWYVVHNYSGHENKVKATIEKAVKTREMEDCIKQVIVPTEDVIETTKVKEKVKEDGKVKEVHDTQYTKAIEIMSNKDIY